MSNRERWIVYPLLFFSIMLGLSDLIQRSGLLAAWTGPPRFAQVRCRQLVIEGVDRQPLAALNQNEFGEVQLSMLGDDQPAVLLKAGEGGGQLILLRTTDEKAILLGHDARHKHSGLQAVELKHGQIERLNTDDGAIEVLPW